MTTLWFRTALLSDGWVEDVRLRLDGGTIAAVERGAEAGPGDERHAVALPGLPNLHSHAFQRAIAGRTEAPGGAGRDDFWSWREQMYGVVGRLTPEDVAAVAAMAFVEMLEAGFTRVGEFHYVHHQPNGTLYDDIAELAAAVAAASAEAGIGLTLLPVFYAHSDFGGVAPNVGQRRFVNDLDAFARLARRCREVAAGLDGGIAGVAPHSLRAVTPEELTAVAELAPDGPIHIHVAEQVREVEACLAWSGRRPVEWLLDNAEVYARWCLVHATHVTEAERAAIIASGAVVGLCPVTEANLGDGIFPAAAFNAEGGRWGVGSDSNVRIDATEELRLLEYGQRLSLRGRNLMAAGGRSTGRSLFAAALAGGAQALGAPKAALAEGAPADIVSIRAAGEGDAILDDWIFARSEVEAVWRAGRPVVRDGRHVARDAIERRFSAALSRLIE